MSHILILVAHPQLEESKACAALVRSVDGMDYVKIADIRKQPYAPEAYAHDIASANTLVFLFPLYWGNCPAILKQWLDACMLDLMEKPGLQGKKLMVATTTGAPQDSYPEHSGNGAFSLDDILCPFRFSANYAGMTYLPPFGLYGTMVPQAEEHIRQGAVAFRNLIQQLAND